MIQPSVRNLLAASVPDWLTQIWAGARQRGVDALTLGVRPVQLRPIDNIGAVVAPILVASGTQDDRTPLDEARALFARAPEPKQFWAVDGAAHVDLERYAPDQYWSVVLPFLVKYMR